MKFSWSYFAIKMTSRKLWLAVAGLAVAIMALLNVDSDTQVKITALIGAVSIVVGYLIANGLTDDGPTTTITDRTAAETTVEDVVTVAATTDTNTAAVTAASTKQVTAGRGDAQ